MRTRDGAFFFAAAFEVDDLFFATHVPLSLSLSPSPPVVAALPRLVEGRLGRLLGVGV